QAPGRMNIFDEHPFKVLLDYGHNPAAVKTVCETVDLMETAGSNLVVLAAPGDRRNEDIIDIATNTAGHFEHYFCKADDDRRGRDDDEIPRMQKQALIDAGVKESQITIIPDEEEAIEAALNKAEPGDLLVIFGDNIVRCWKQITRFNEADKARSKSPIMSKQTSEATTPDPFELVPAMKLIRDEKGVRLAREPEESD
ncbi:MAG: cyanophycin synthetase, partial [Bacteroidetes bacterium]|nr:cyanophycin synthetase [Bacteroidota bacterium]